MPDDKQNAQKPSEQEVLETKKRMEKLARAIRDEMDSMTRLAIAKAAP